MQNRNKNSLLSVDGFPASSVTAGKIATLTHKVLDDAMEGAALVAEPLLSRTQGTEVLCERQAPGIHVLTY